MHRRPEDYAFFKQLQPAMFKIMDGGDNDYAWARANLPNSIIVARDWALSEQHEDMLRDPVGTGQRHAAEWNNHQKRLGFDKTKTMILGLNEPKIWQPGVPEALRLYTIALCDSATQFGLHVSAMQLSVGWPDNHGGETLPDWSLWHGVEQAILRNGGTLSAHEYWADQGPGENWGWWCGRVLKCPWQVPIVIGECGIDMYVKDGSVSKNARGWRTRKSPEQYARELADYVERMSRDSRFKGCAVFAADFASQDWWSFDIEPAYQAILNTPIAEPTPPKPEPPRPEPPTPTPAGKLAHPLPGATITQHWGQTAPEYSPGLWGHGGTDLAGRAEGSPVLSIADGEVAWSDFDEGYGHYVRATMTGLDAYALYAHLQEPGAPAGTVLRAGDPVGVLGSTGNSTGVHLHLEIRLSDDKGGYRGGAPMPRGRVCPETWCCLHDLKL